jgi:hypothetical protein
MRKIEVTHRERLAATRPNIFRNRKKYTRKEKRRSDSFLFLVIVLIILLLSSCKTKESITDRTIVKDTISKEIVISNPFTDELIIENFCPETSNDTAVQKKFIRDYKSEKLAFQLQLENNRLKLILSGSGDTISKKEYKGTVKEKEFVKTQEKGLWITKWFWYSVALNIILLLYCFRKPLWGLLQRGVF